MSALSSDPPHSVFDPECPQCEAALRPAEGSIWSCPGCGFTAERVGGVLLELPRDTPDRGPEPGPGPG